MKTYTISIGTFEIKVRSRAHDETGQENYQNHWRTLRTLRTATKDAILARLRDLLNRVEEYYLNKDKVKLAQWPPHSLFCEKRCCQKAFSSYWRYLKKELKWNKQGHLS